jgi:hypothetical protein
MTLCDLQILSIYTVGINNSIIYQNYQLCLHIKIWKHIILNKSHT